MLYFCWNCRIWCRGWCSCKQTRSKSWSSGNLYILLLALTG